MTEGGEELFDLPLAEADPEIAALVESELARQRATLDLVASENVPPRAVLEAQGSILTAKYADGYPGRRTYDTCEVIDEIEQLAIDRVKALFCAEHANVQPYSGASANAAALRALCEPGETVLGWRFDHGGHPTHHDPETSAGHFYRTATYGVRRDDRLVDMDEVERLARELSPKVIVTGWSCYSRWLDFRRFRAICDEVGAFLVVDMAHFSGLVAAGLHPDPVPYADLCTMTVHKTLGGARGGAILSTAELAERVDEAVYPGEQGCPLPHVIAAKAVTFALAASEGYRARIRRTLEGARLLAEVLEANRGRTDAPVVTGGTDVHQLLVDLAPSGRRAPEVLAELNRGGISANAIRLAYDEAPAGSSSGLRLGTAALASRGCGDEEFRAVGELLADALDRSGPGGPDLWRERVDSLLEPFPLYRDR